MIIMMTMMAALLLMMMGIMPGMTMSVMKGTMVMTSISSTTRPARRTH